MCVVIMICRCWRNVGRGGAILWGCAVCRDGHITSIWRACFTCCCTCEISAKDYIGNSSTACIKKYSTFFFSPKKYICSYLRQRRFCGLRLLGVSLVHENTDGTAPGFLLLIPDSFLSKSDGKKWAEHTLVAFVTLKRKINAMLNSFKYYLPTRTSTSVWGCVWGGVWGCVYMCVVGGLEL